MPKAAKVVNYTPEMTAAIVADYKDGITVEAIAAKVGKSVRSIVAKLSREKVYVAKVRTAKNGEAVVKKETAADEIGAMLELTEADTSSLAKANKTALVAVLKALKA
jgi:hypothetical protein